MCAASAFARCDEDGRNAPLSSPDITLQSSLAPRANSLVAFEVLDEAISVEREGFEGVVE